MSRVTSIRNLAALATAVILPLSVLAFHPAPTGMPSLFRGGNPAAPAAFSADVEKNADLLVEAIIQIESNGDPRKVGRHGERGLMQIKSGTWRDMTTRLFGQPLPFARAFEPALNRRVGTAYLAFLQERLLARQTEWKSDERSLLLAAYNAGPGRLRASGFDLARLPDQTQDYVARASALHNVYLNEMADAIRRRLLAANGSAAAGI